MHIYICIYTYIYVYHIQEEVDVVAVEREFENVKKQLAEVRLNEQIFRGAYMARELPPVCIYIHKYRCMYVCIHMVRSVPFFLAYIYIYLYIYI
jgi:hypothetical protein